MQRPSAQSAASCRIIEPAGRISAIRRLKSGIDEDRLQGAIRFAVAPYALNLAGGCGSVRSASSVKPWIADRSVRIELRRRLPYEKIEGFRFDRTAHLEELACKAARWTMDNVGLIKGADPGDAAWGAQPRCG